VTMLTSAMVSRLIQVEQHMLTPLSMLLMPSSFTLMLSLRLPLIVARVLVAAGVPGYPRDQAHEVAVDDRQVDHHLNREWPDLC